MASYKFETLDQDTFDLDIGYFTNFSDPTSFQRSSDVVLRNQNLINQPVAATGLPLRESYVSLTKTALDNIQEIQKQGAAMPYRNDVTYHENAIVLDEPENLLKKWDGMELVDLSVRQFTVYSVNSAKTTNGLPAFINANVNNSQIDFDVTVPVVVCYPDGTIESNATLASISGITTNDTYYIIKEKGSAPYITTLEPVENYIAPTSPATNQLWLDISVKPYLPKKWNGSAWVLNQFVKLGQFTRTGGIILSPTNYALNGKYISPLTSFSYGSVININHNLGFQSSLIVQKTVLVNITAQYGYVPGDTLAGALLLQASTSPGDIFASSLDCAISQNTAQFNPYGSSGGPVGIRGLQKNTTSIATSITSSSWRLVFSFQRNF